MSWIRDSALSYFQSFCLKVVQCGPIPKHVAIIMDGNRRYAKKHNVPKGEGHSRGFEKLSETLQWCLDFGIKEVTVYAFSIENFKRSEEEVNILLNLAREKFQRLLDEKDKLNEKGVCIRIIGNLELLPDDLRQLIAKAIIMTENNNSAILNVAFAYTSRDEMTNAVHTIVNGVINGALKPDNVSEYLLSQCMYTKDSADPDLLIRTSGEVRLSDFLLWQTAGSCCYFTDVLWPDFNFWHLLKAVLYYQRCYSDLQILKIKKKPYSDDENANINHNNVHKFIDNVTKSRRNTLQMYADKIL